MELLPLQKCANDDTVYLHGKWYPRNIFKSRSRTTFHGTLKEKSRFNYLIITYSRPEKLWNCLMKTMKTQLSL